MEPVTITEDEINNLTEVFIREYMDIDDPRSIFYPRHLNRPNINWKKIFLSIFETMLLFVCVNLLIRYIGFGKRFVLVINLVLFIIVFLLSLKNIEIYLVKIYQRYAPDKIRKKCRFEPSCSEYMIMSIEKYGRFKGLAKGIKRLARCNKDNGGYDYP